MPTPPVPRRKLAVAVTRDALQRICYPRSTGTPQEHLDRLHDLTGPRATRVLSAVGDTIELLLGNPAGSVSGIPQHEGLPEAEPEAEAGP